MRRKLIHSIRATAFSFGLLAVAATVGTLDRTGKPNALEKHVGFSIESSAEARTALSAETGTRDEAKPTSSKRHRRKQARDAMALPFVSFAQVLRRGNGD
jgi:hypothetical protein